ncbi:MAG: RNA polymerase sigma factor [Clostridia bacterium]|nr:RNA polymerase sigma factor [Clostridia bacterium]
MAEILEEAAFISHEKRDERLAGLVSEVRKGGKSADKAFESMVRLLERGVFELSYHIVRSREDAMDVSQNTFVKLWQLLSGESELAPVKSWYSYVLRMARNCSLDFLRKQSIRRYDSLSVVDEDGERKELEIPDDDVSSDPVMAYERSEKIEAVRKAINSLDQDHRQILVLRETEGCSYKEISDIMGIEMGTVKSKIFRARNQVKEYLERRNIL